MEANVYGIDGNASGRITLPHAFEEEYRGDLVRRALLSEQTESYQPKAHYILAGLQTTAIYVGKYSGYRRGRHMGIAIRPRQKLGGGAMGDVRRIPSSVKGRRAHPHKLEKRIVERINKREYAKAIASAIGGSTRMELVKNRHTIKKETTLPIVIDDRIEQVSKVKELLNILNAFALTEDMERSHRPRLLKNNRKARRRAFRKTVLIVANNTEKIERAGRNIPGLDVCNVNHLTIGKLAPGASPRITIWSKSAVENLKI